MHLLKYFFEIAHINVFRAASFFFSLEIWSLIFIYREVHIPHMHISLNFYKLDVPNHPLPRPRNRRNIPNNLNANAPAHLLPLTLQTAIQYPHFVRFIPIVVCTCKLSTLNDLQGFTVWGYHNVYTHSTIDGHMCCFQLGAMLKSILWTFCTWLFVETFSFLWVEPLGHRVGICLILLATAHWYSHQGLRCPITTHPHQYLVFLVFSFFNLIQPFQ